jgi:hypothetical protein
MPKKIYTVGYASGIAAREHGSEDGPFFIQRSPFNDALAENGAENGLALDWENIIRAPSSSPSSSGLSNNIPAIADLCTQLAQKTASIVTTGNLFLTIGAAIIPVRLALGAALQALLKLKAL